MKRTMNRRLLLAGTVAALAAAGAGSLYAPWERAEAGPRGLTVAAASDLQLAFPEVGRKFEEKTGVKVTFSFGSTGNLARQIEHGAPFDLFFAANESFVERLEMKGLLVPGTRRLYAVGPLVLASSRKPGVGVKDLSGLLDPRVHRIAIANPEHAPYGAAAREALMKAGLWEKLQPKIVLGENIRHALQFVQTGNAEAGLIARSVADVPEIAYRPVDPRLYSPLKQAAAVVRGSRNEAGARRFLEDVTGKEGQSILRRYGFSSPAER